MENTRAVISITPQFNLQIREYQLLILKRYGIKKTKADIIQKFAQMALTNELNIMNNGQAE